MLKSEAERIINKISEEHNCEFTEEQKTALAEIILRISSTVVEEALASMSTNKSNRGQFFA